MTGTLILGARLGFSTRRADVRLAGGRIAEIGTGLRARPAEDIVEGKGGALLPALADHHLHLLSLAAARNSLACGPPEVTDAEGLAARLRQVDCTPGSAGRWLRGVLYHESVAGEIDRDWLDRHAPTRPVRVQHRSGRMWIFNSAALALLAPFDDSPLEMRHGRPTGRLLDGDAWLRARLGPVLPDIAGASRRLAARGVVRITDASPGNDRGTQRLFARLQEEGALLQDVLLMGGADLDGAAPAGNVAPGPMKFHLHDHDLPDLDPVVARIRDARAAGRASAFHCVTVAELVFALAALAEAGGGPGDRIEHAAVVPPDLLPVLAAARATVVTQPHFIAERGDAYRADVAPDELPWLYRVAGLTEAGIACAGGSDAPFGAADPWAAMAAAVARRTRSGVTMGAAEAVAPETALALFTGPPERPGLAGSPTQALRPGSTADLCLLDRGWHAARRDLAAVCPRAVWLGGRRVHPMPEGA